MAKIYKQFEIDNSHFGLYHLETYMITTESKPNNRTAVTYFIFLIGPFSGNVDGEVRGTKKAYFCDNGLLNYLGKVSEWTLFENLVFHNLKKYGDLYYYQKYKGPEVDFLLNGKSALEVKITGVTSDINRLHRTANNLKVKDDYLITKNWSDFPNVILAQDL